MTSYSDLARTLPVPTEEQARKFADYVTQAHSWYKHLRTNPPVPFVFYLDPNAGRAMVHVSDDEAVFVDHVDESKAFHYTWQTTESYRQRFGYWNYHAPYGTSFQFQREEGVVDTAGTGLMVLFEETGWFEVPKGLALAGTALVTALMHAWYSPGDAGPPAFEFGSPFVSPPHALGENDFLPTGLLEPSSVVPADIAEAMRRLEVVWNGEQYRREKVQAYRAVNELRARTSEEVKATGRKWDDVQDRDVSSRAYREAEDSWEKTESRRRERSLMAPALEAIKHERQRQISGMVAAMKQFSAVLHAESRP